MWTLLSKIVLLFEKHSQNLMYPRWGRVQDNLRTIVILRFDNCNAFCIIKPILKTCSPAWNLWLERRHKKVQFHFKIKIKLWMSQSSNQEVNMVLWALYSNVKRIKIMFNSDSQNLLMQLSFIFFYIIFFWIVK